MSRMTCYLVACTMALATVMGMDSGTGGIQFGIGSQCQTRGHTYAGACISQNTFDGELTCLSLVCAVLRNGVYLAVPTGPVDDGTLCGLNRVCKRGVCASKAPMDIEFPVGTEPRFNCVSWPSEQISGYPPGSNPARNRPAIEIPSVKGERPVRIEIPSPPAPRRRRPAASTSNGSQPSPPAASTSKGSSHHSRSAVSTSKGSHHSRSAASTSKGSHHARSAASTSKGSHHASSTASTSKGSHHARSAASTSKGSHHARSAASTSKGSHSSQSTP